MEGDGRIEDRGDPVPARASGGRKENHHALQPQFGGHGGGAPPHGGSGLQEIR